MPYKDPEKQKAKVKEIKEKWLGKATINFLKDEPCLYAAFKTAIEHERSYAKKALREKLIRDGYMLESDK